VVSAMRTGFKTLIGVNRLIASVNFNNRERTERELRIFQSDNRRGATPKLFIIHY